MPNESGRRRGFRWDETNSELEIEVDGTKVLGMTSAGVTNGTIAAAAITDNSLNGDQVAVVADDNTEGGIPVVFRIDIASVGATALTANTDVTMVDKIRIIDYVIYKTGGTTGGGNENISILSTGAVIGDVHSWTGVDKTVLRPTTIDDAQSTIDAGEILRVTVDTSITDEESDTGHVVVTAMKIA